MQTVWSALNSIGSFVVGLAGIISVVVFAFVVVFGARQMIAFAVKLMRNDGCSERQIQRGLVTIGLSCLGLTGLDFALLRMVESPLAKHAVTDLMFVLGTCSLYAFWTRSVLKTQAELKQAVDASRAS